MMAVFINVKRYFSNLFLDFKMLCRNNKLVLFSLIAAVTLGMILSIDSNMKDTEINIYSGNIIILIINDNFNIFLHILKMAFFIAIIYAFIIFAKFHFGLYICNFAFILIFVRMMFRALFFAFLFDGIFSLFYFFFFWLPIACYAFICYFICLCKVYLLLGFDKCKGRPLCCPAGNSYLHIILKNYAYIIIPVLVYNLLFIFIVSLIY